MKKILLFAILALSINAFAQSKHPSSNSLENVRGRMELEGKTTFSTHSDRNLGQAFKHQTPNQDSLIKIFDSIYMWQWDTLNIGWRIYNKTINMVYNANHKQTSYIVQSWNESAWVNAEEQNLTYDVNNNLTSELIQSWNGTAWVNYTQFIFTYDVNNNWISGLNQNWNGSAWVNTSQTICTYDANNNMTSQSFQTWDGSVWVNNEKDSYTQDAHDNLINELVQNWNGSVWVNHTQFINIYDVNNKLTSGLNQSWNGSAWVNSKAYTLTYDVNNILISYLTQNWNGSVWVNYNQLTYTYNANNNWISGLNQNWNGSTWVNNSQNSYTYDANNFRKSNSYKYWNIAGTKVAGGDSTYYYFHTVLGINDLKMRDASITVYPNPSSKTITIELSHTTAIKSAFLTIISLNGQQLIARQISERKTQLDISNLPSGVYFIRVTTDRTVEVGKIIKQ